MTELPIVVDMTVSGDDIPTLTVGGNEVIELQAEEVIDSGGSSLPEYQGPYTVDAGTSAVVLDTDGKRMTDDVTVNALTENTLSDISLSVNQDNGEITASVSLSSGYNAMGKGKIETISQSTQSARTITPTTSEQTAVARGKYTTGAVKVRAIPSPYYDCSGVTATASDVLAGKYFVNSSGVLILGTGTGGSMDSDTKDALLDCFENVAWIGNDGETYYNALLNALYPLQSISAVYTQSGTVYTTTSLDDLKSDLVVTATFEDNTTKTVTNYTLSGTLTVGTSTITVTYFTETTTFNVTVTASVQVPELFTNTGLTSTNGGVPYIDSNTVSTARAAGVSTTGTYPFREGSATSTTYSNYYPVPIPNGATGVTITSNYTDWSVIEAYYPSNDWIRLTSSGWLLKSTSTTHSYTFTNNNSTHIWLVIREAGKASGGSVTQAMLNDIQFSWNY